MGTTATLTEEDLKAVTLQSMPGGKYTGIANGDGTWNVLNFPIFTVVLKGEKGAPEDIREKWMDAAFAKAKAREKGDQFWGPAHVNHHGEPKPTAHAGYLRFRNRGEIVYESEKLPAIFADAVRVPEAVFREMEAGRLAYVSVEIASWVDPEIASVAFMSDETSFFRLPLFTIGDKLIATDAVRVSPDAHIPQIAYRPTLRASSKSFILFKLGSEKTVDEKAKAKAALEAAFAAFVKLDGGAAGGTGGDAGGSPGDAGGGDSGGGDSGGDAAFYFAMMEYAAKKLKAMGQKLAQGEAAETEAQEQVEQAGRKEQSRAKPAEVNPKANAEVTGMTKEELAAFVAEQVNAATVKVEAKFSAKLDGAEAKLAAIDEEKRITGMVEKAKADLAGWYVSPETVALLNRLARIDKDGKALNEHVAFHKTNVLREPPTGGRRGGSAPTASAKDPEAVAKFSNSPNEYAKAKKLQGEYELAKQTGHTSLSLERFLEVGMKLPARQMEQPEEQATAQAQ